MMQRNRLFVTLLMTLGLSALVVPITTAQTAPPTPGFEERARKKTTLDRDSKEVADEYADILHELETLVRDYRDYLQESESEHIVTYMRKLDKLNSNLDRRVYVSDRDLLIEDLSMHEEELEELEEYIRDSEEIFPMHIYKLVMAFRRDLNNIHGLLEGDVLERMPEDRALEQAIEAYVMALLEDMQIETHGDRVTVAIPQLDEKKLAEIERKAKLIEKKAEKAARQAEKNAYKYEHNVPVPPTPPDVKIYTPQNIPGVMGLGGTGTSKELNGQLQVSNTKLPVRISTPLGEVHVVGTNAKRVLARLEAEVAADSRSREKELLSQVNLTLTSTDKGYTVDAVLPTNTGKNTRVIGSALEVEVPAGNPVIIENAFGEVTVSNLTSGVNIKSSYSQIDVDGVKGGVTVDNSMGEVELNGCGGPINVKNAYGSVSLNGCNGELDIENAYSEILLEGCNASGSIENSGTVEVTNHTGNLKINNSFGPIEVDGLKGNLTASNQFQPLSIRNIAGIVTLENTNSNIECADINGPLVVNNKFGLIQCESLAGPIKLNNENGNIYLILADKLKGSSIVSASYGQVDVSIPKTANVWLKAKTTFGDIKSYFPMKIDETSTAKTAAMKLGQGADSLLINGTNTTILINDSK